MGLGIENNEARKKLKVNNSNNDGNQLSARIEIENLIKNHYEEEVNKNVSSMDVEGSESQNAKNSSIDLEEGECEEPKSHSTIHITNIEEDGKQSFPVNNERSKGFGQDPHQNNK